ncbi:MAG: VOC family protein [Verrucomicrobiales bacterium]
MNQHEKISYVEFPSRDLSLTKPFFEKAFGWTFEDYGPEYAAFSNEGLDGGFFHSEKASSAENGAAVVIFYSGKLEETQANVEAASGVISTPTFPFPGGRRFHFTEQSGNEFAVWSNNEPDS